MNLDGQRNFVQCTLLDRRVYVVALRIQASEFVLARSKSDFSKDSGDLFSGHDRK